jgi:hypothetical protein
VRQQSHKRGHTKNKFVQRVLPVSTVTSGVVSESTDVTSDPACLLTRSEHDETGGCAVLPAVAVRHDGVTCGVTATER